MISTSPMTPRVNAVLNGLCRALCLAFLLFLARCDAQELPPTQQGYPSQSKCPQRILDAAQVAIASRVGQDFFTSYIHLDGCSHFTNGEWAVSYHMRIPTRPWIDEPVSVTVDSTGAAVGEARGVCDCIQDPSACSFGVDESTAVGIAKRAGFDPERSPWGMVFEMVATDSVPRYAWVITNPTHLEPDGCSGSYRTIAIDASTGKVVSESGFHMQCCLRFPVRPHAESDGKAGN